MKITPFEPSDVARYDGRRLLGRVVEAGTGQCRAFDADDNPIGTFPTRHEAMAAIDVAATERVPNTR